MAELEYGAARHDGLVAQIRVGEGWTVRQVMSAPVHSAAPTTGVKQLVRTLREYGISALPVEDGEGRLLGVVSEADVLVTGSGGVTAPTS